MVGQGRQNTETHTGFDINNPAVSTNGVRSSNDDNNNVKPQNKKSFLSGNFSTYMKMKQQQRQTNNNCDARTTESAIDDNWKGDDRNIIEEQEHYWNHFTTPLMPVTAATASRTKQNKVVDITASTTQSSVFSNLERTQTIDRFGRVFMNRMGDVMASGKLSAAWGSNSSGNSASLISWLYTDYSPNATNNKQLDTNNFNMLNPEDYAAERRMIKPHLTPFVWGTTCIAVTFFSMRLGRWYQGRTTLGITATSSLKNNSSSSILNRSNLETATSHKSAVQDMRISRPPRSFNNIDINPSSYQNQKNALLTNLSTLPVDLAISLLVGISTSIFLTRPVDLLNDFSSAPLIQGRSVLSEELCQLFSEEMDQINQGYHIYSPPPRGQNSAAEKQVVSFQELWKNENLGDFESLRAIRDFVQNCHQRERLVERSRQKE
jgi:hypothetical protein